MPKKNKTKKVLKNVPANENHNKPKTVKKGEPSESEEKGCNCPVGCKRGEPILPSAALNPDPAEMIFFQCSNATCPEVPYLHTECVEKFEKELINRMVHASSTARMRSWTAQQIQDNIWDKKGYELLMSHCRCRCTGFIRRPIDDERAAEARKQQKKQNSSKAQAAAAASSSSAAKASGGEASGGTAAGSSKPSASLPKLNTTVTPSASKHKFSFNVQQFNERFKQHHNSTLPEPRKNSLLAEEDETSAKPQVPVGTTGWRQATYGEPCEQQQQQPCSSKSRPPRTHTQSPTVSSDGTNSDLTSVSQQGGAQVAIDKLTAEKQTFLADLTQMLVDDDDHKIWELDKRYQDLLARYSCELSLDIAELGLEQWLKYNSTHLYSHHSNIMHKEYFERPSCFESTGEVSQLLDEYGIAGIIEDPRFSTRVLFTADTTRAADSHQLMVGDIVKFEAEKLSSPRHSCAHQASLVERLQRARATESDTALAAAALAEAAVRDDSGVATANGHEELDEAALEATLGQVFGFPVDLNVPPPPIPTHMNFISAPPPPVVGATVAQPLNPQPSSVAHPAASPDDHRSEVSSSDEQQYSRASDSPDLNTRVASASTPHAPPDTTLTASQIPSPADTFYSTQSDPPVSAVLPPPKTVLLPPAQHATVTSPVQQQQPASFVSPSPSPPAGAGRGRGRGRGRGLLKFGVPGQTAAEPVAPGQTVPGTVAPGGDGAPPTSTGFDCNGQAGFDRSRQASGSSSVRSSETSSVDSPIKPFKPPVSPTGVSSPQSPPQSSAAAAATPSPGPSASGAPRSGPSPAAGSSGSPSTAQTVVAGRPIVLPQSIAEQLAKRSQQQTKAFKLGMGRGRSTLAP